MAFYRTGKAALAADGTVTGTGTAWKSSLSLIRVGATMIFLTNPIKLGVISEIVTDTQLKLITTNGATQASGDYVILLNDSLTVDGLAQDVAETLRYYQGKETSLQAIEDFFKTFDFDAFKKMVDDTKTNADAAKASQTAAATSASQALGYRNTANTAATNATTQANNASTSANNASTSETNAAKSASDAAALVGNAQNAWQDRGRLPDGANINTFNPATTEGTWHISGIGTVTEVNGFPPGASRGILTVVNGGYNSGTQVYVDQAANQWVRSLTTTWNGENGPWSSWIATDGARGVIANADLDTYTNSMIGRWAVTNSTFATAANHYPVVGSAGIGEFEVTAGGNILQQTMKTRYGRMFTRTIYGTWNGTGTPTWTEWFEVGYQPQDGFYNDDLNSLVTPGVFNITSGVVNSPLSVTGVCRVSLRASASQVLQEFYVVVGSGSNANRKFTRTMAGSSWTAWDEVIGQKDMAALGIGVSNPAIANFDWQTFNFASGANYQIAGATQTNAPSPIDSLTGMSLGITVLGLSGDPSSTTGISWCLMLVSAYVNGTGSTRRMFHVIFRGTNGTRSYSVMEIIAGSDASDARTRLGLGASATRNVGTTTGTVADGNDSRLNTVNNKSGGTVTSALSVTAQVGANNFFAASAPAPNIQGTHIGWNAEGGSGATDIYNNKGAGNGGFNFRIVNSSNTQELQKFQLRYDGVGLAPGGWQTGSDINVKQDVKPVVNALPSVISLTGTTWLYKRRFGGDERLTPGVGLIAQQVEAFCPQAVSTNEEVTYFDDGTALLEHKSLDVSGVSAAYHNEAIKELFALVKLAINDPDAAKTKIEEIEKSASSIKVDVGIEG